MRKMSLMYVTLIGKPFSVADMDIRIDSDRGLAIELAQRYHVVQRAWAQRDGRGTFGRKSRIIGSGRESP